MRNFTQNSLHKKQKGSSKKLKRIIWGVLIFLILQYVYYGFINKAAVESKNIATITVNQGDSVKIIAKKLKKANIINSKFMFKIYAKFSNKDRTIQSGTFNIPLPQNIPSTLFFLANNISNEQRITIPEGYKITQIDQLLSDKELIQPGQFTECAKNCKIEHDITNYIPQGKGLEGFLFPDTYFINKENFTSEELIYKMLNNFESKLPTNWEFLAKKLPEKDLYTIINMASIIEREVLSTKDKKIVSGLLWKRYTSGWLLGADATLLYEKTDNIITRTDLEKDSDYNTRKFKGFPPTPISNPGEQSIEAALEPTDSRYWFYLTTLDTGEVIYAETNEQHNANKRKYL
jgi:UPF0755 protein